MSYQNIDTSIHDGEPIELYEFVRGVDVTRMNTGAVDIVEGPFTYSASPISRNRIRQGEGIFKENIKITLPRGDLFASQFLVHPPEAVTTVTVKRMHRSMTPGEAIVVWKGRISGTEANGDQIELDCESIYTSMRRLGLAPKFEITCIHAVYNERCRANKPSFRVDAVVEVVDGTQLTMLDIAGYEDDYFSAGMIEYGGNRRMIVSHANSILHLSRPIPGVSAATEVALYPGCDKIRGTCLDKFDNIDNFLGFPWMPDKNPFSSRIT